MSDDYGLTVIEMSFRNFTVRHDARSAAESVDAAEHRMKIQMRWAFASAIEYLRQPGET